MSTNTLPEGSQTAIAIENLQFQFNRDAGAVLHIPYWEVPLGERIFLQGDSGSGKSTLLNLVAGLLLPTAGSVTVLGTGLGSLGVRGRDRFRAQHVGVVFQQFNLIPYLSVMDNILLAAQFGGAGAATLRSRAAELLDQVNLDTGLHGRPANQLSIGQQQRVAIVRALINSPELLLVDEPTSALDHSNRDAFLRLLFEVLDVTGSAMVFVSHDPTIGDYFENRVVLGELNQAGVPS